MNVGDLVIMPGSAFRDAGNGRGGAMGIVVAPPYTGPNGERQQTPRVGVLWSDGEGVDWEPQSWLEVISESR